MLAGRSGLHAGSSFPSHPKNSASPRARRLRRSAVEQIRERAVQKLRRLWSGICAHLPRTNQERSGGFLEVTSEYIPFSVNWRDRKQVFLTYVHR
jgi:hypothetical protein